MPHPLAPPPPRPKNTPYSVIDYKMHIVNTYYIPLKKMATLKYLKKEPSEIVNTAMIKIFKLMLCDTF